MGQRRRDQADQGRDGAEEGGVLGWEGWVGPHWRAQSQVVDLILRSRAAASRRMKARLPHQPGYMVRDGAFAPPHHEDLAAFRGFISGRNIEVAANAGGEVCRTQEGLNGGLLGVRVLLDDGS